MINKYKKRPKPANRYGDLQVYQFSQRVDNVPYNRCAYFAPLIACMSLMNVDIGEKGLREFIQYFLDRGRKSTSGAYYISGAKILLEYRNNKYPDHKCKMVEMRIGSRKHRISLSRGNPSLYSIEVGDLFRSDRADGILTHLDYTQKYDGEYRMGHVITAYEDLNGQIKFIDSSGQIINQYEIPNFDWFTLTEGLFKRPTIISIEPLEYLKPTV